MTTAYPKTPDLSIVAGARVRSYDFAFSTECYVEGVVEEVMPNGHYRVRVERRVVEGAEVPFYSFDGCVYPPVNGLSGLFGPTRGVVRI